MTKRKKYTFMIIPDDEKDSWSFNLSKAVLQCTGFLMISLCFGSLFILILYFPKLSYHRDIEANYNKLISERLKVLELSQDLKKIKQMDRMVRNTLGEKLDIDNPILIEDSISSLYELPEKSISQLKNIPSGQFVHNIEMIPGKGAQMARSAGAYVQVMAHDNNYVTLKMPSGEVRMVLDKCLATVGVVGNKQHELVRSGKAGRSRWLGRRPKVRGVAMNPVDHPMGGGEGKSSGGRHPVSPWGKPTKGYKTRKKNKKSNALIVKRRND